MAYWMTHLRVAETALRYLPGLSALHYYAGALGPDCGHTEQNPDGSPRYLPGRVVSHWLQKNEERDTYEFAFEEFFRAWMPKAEDGEQRAFYWGYYIHLITDAMWKERVLRPRRESLAEPTAEAMEAIKKDIYRADLRFLQDHPDYAPLKVIEGIGTFPNRYLDYYNDTDLEEQLHAIPVRLRAEAAGPVEESLWLSDEELDEFVMFATAKCIQMVKSHLPE